MAADEVHIMANAGATDTADLHTHAGKTMIGKNRGILFTLSSSLYPSDISDLSDGLSDNLNLTASITSILVLDPIE
jgi:hypothetical protein